MKVIHCLLSNCLPAFFLETVVQHFETLNSSDSHPCAFKTRFNQRNSPPHCVNPLSVAEGKKLHLVLDLSEVNRYLVKCNFRFEDLRSLAEVFQEGFCFFTWDLKSG